VKAQFARCLYISQVLTVIDVVVQIGTKSSKRNLGGEVRLEMRGLISTVVCFAKRSIEAWESNAVLEGNNSSQG
jgi:hypothetical protein